MTDLAEPKAHLNPVARHFADDRGEVRVARRAEFTGGWLALLTAFVGVAMGAATLVTHSAGALFLPIIKEYGWTRAELSLGITSFGFFGMVGTPFIGALVDRFSVRLVAGISVLACATVLFLLSRFEGTLSKFLLFMASLGLIGAGTSAVVYVALVTTWFDRARGFAIGIALAGSGLSAIVVSKLMIPYVAQAGWRMGYQALAIVMLATLPLVLVGARHYRASASRGGAPEVAMEGLTWPEALRTTRFWRLSLAMVLMGLGLVGFYVHFVPLITDRGLLPAQAANAAAIFGAAVLCGRLIAGYLLDRVYPPMVAAGAMLLAVACLGLLLIEGTPQTYLAGAAIGLAVGTALNFGGYVTARIFGRRAYGKIYSVQFAVFSAGGLLSPILYGFIHDRTGSYGYAVGASMVMLSAAIPVLLLLGTHPEPARQ